MVHDVVIVGGGPAGLTAALYTARRSLSTIIVSKDVGGQAATTSSIENYPGVGVVDGYELMERFKDQAVQYGAKFEVGEVHGIVKRDDENFDVSYNTEVITTRSVILAFGLTPRSLGVLGEAEFVGRGVSFSAAAEVESMRDKTAVVIGGGNSAIEAVNLLADIAKKVYLVHRRDRFRAEEVLVSKMQNRDNVEQILNAQLLEVRGDKSVTSVIVGVGKDNESRELEVDGVFINVGFMSKTQFVKGVAEVNEKNEIIINEHCHASTPGVFAAGDITTANYKQVVVSAGEGCKAALACYTYIMKLDGKEVSVDQDWDASGEHFIRT